MGERLLDQIRRLIRVKQHKQLDTQLNQLTLPLRLILDIHEPGSRREAQSQAETGAKLFERSEFFAPRLNRASEGTPRSGAADLAIAFLLTFCAQKVRRISSRSERRNVFEFVYS